MKLDTNQSWISFRIESVESVIIFKNKHVILRFDGEKVKIEMSKAFKNKQCGMCGHYDDEVEGEFRRADNEHWYVRLVRGGRSRR